MSRWSAARAALSFVLLALVVGCGSYRHLKPVDAHERAWTAVTPSTPPGAPAARAPSPSTSTPLSSPNGRLAVLEIAGSALSPELSALLTDGVRAQALRAVRPRGMTVMTRESQLAILADMGACEALEEGRCEVETGRNIGADLLVTGDVTKVGPQYFLTLKLFEVKGGALLATKSLRAKDAVELVDLVEREGLVLFTEGLGPPA